MRLAHFSDIHVTHFPLSGSFALKRLAAVASYTAMGRGRHFQGSDKRIAELLRDVDAQDVQHAVCSGDITGVSLEAEFQQAAALFGPRLQQPERFTVIPGNHDCYVPGAKALFAQHFGTLCQNAQFPLVKSLAEDVTLVAIDVARPTHVLDSSGLCGMAQQHALEGILTSSSLKEQFVILVMHYGLLRKDGSRDRPSHGLRDDVELMALLDREDVNLDVVLHGHMHRPYSIRTQRRLIVNAGSATDIHVADCGYNLYDIDASHHRLTVHRRVWNRAEQRYVSASSWTATSRTSP